MCQSGANVAVLDHTSRAPGVVARLTGLECLPHPHRHHHHRRSQSDTPILLQDPLKRDYKSRRREESRFRKKSVSLLASFRCRPEVSCVSPAYIDSRILCTVRTSPFLSRLAQTSRDDSPSCAPANHEAIPELGLRATTAGSTVLLQGWPLESQRIVPPDIFDEDEESNFMSTTDSATAIGSYTVALERRRGSLESGIEQDVMHRITGRVMRGVSHADKFVPSPGRHRGELVFKTTRRPARSGGKLCDSSSRSSTVSEESTGCVSSKMQTGLVGKRKVSKTGRVTSNLVEEDESKQAVSSLSRLKEVKPPLPKVRNEGAKEKYSAKGADGASKGAADCASKRAHFASLGAGFASNGASSVVGQTGAMSTSSGIKFFGGRKEGDRARVVKKKSGAHDPSPPPFQRFTEKASSGAQPRKRVQDFGERLKKGSSADVATQSSTTTDESAMLRFKRKNKQHHARARSVDDVFRELPLENSKPVERVLFVSSPDMEFSTDCKQISSSPLVDFATGACIVGRLSASFKDVDYEKGVYEEDYGELQADVQNSESPLVDCHEKLPNNVSGEGECLCCEEEAAELTVSTLCCSGPSVSSGSLPSDVEDTWSSCAESQLNYGSYCHLPRPFEITKSVEVDPKEHHYLPPTLFVKNMMDPLVDEELGPQPSHVSILDLPFLDEPCTPSEPTLTGSLHQKLNSEEELNPLVSTSDKLRQALLDISMFRTQEDSSTTNVALSYECKDERKFIRGVLVAANFLGPSLPKWYDCDVAINPSLFDKLEGNNIEFTCQQVYGGLWRCNWKLLFDCVNEALHHEEDRLVLWRLQGERLVVEVEKRINGWRMLASRAIDSLIKWDMSTEVGNWKRFVCEVEEVGVEVESFVWRDLLDEVVGDMVHVLRRDSLLKRGVD